MSSEKPTYADRLRERAEALLEKSPDAFQPEDIKDVNTLAHELAVHQAELELQNEELRNTQIALQKIRDRYAALFENAPVGYVVLDASGIIRQTNATWCAMLGRPGEDFRGTPFAETLLPEDAPIFLSRFRAFFRNPIEKQIVVRIKRSGARPFYGQIEARPRDAEPDSEDGAASAKELMVIVSDITERRLAEEELKKIEWMLTDKPPVDHSSSPERDIADQGYGDLTALNQGGLILQSIEPDMLKDISAEYLNLLETSSAIYEKNGDYAYGIFSSGWCRLLDSSSRKLCQTDDNEAALACGKWLCHESCWTDCSKRAIESQSPVDIECNGGLHIYAVPIFSAGEVIGAINFGYGDPPRDDAKLKALADAYQLDQEELARKADAYSSRPAYIIELAKQRLLSSARVIGLMVERKRIEQELKESEGRFRALHNASFGGITIHDKGLILECNQGLSEITGYTYDELIGMDGLSLISDSTRDKVVHNISAGYEKPYEAEGVRKNGELYPIRLEAREIQYKGKNVRVVEFRDITETKKAEEALRASEELHRTTLASIGDAVISTDADSKVKMMNPVAEILTGWRSEESVGRPMAEVFRIVNANTRETVENPVEKVLASGRIVGLANHTVLIARDGTERQIADSAAPIRNAEGDILGVVLVFRDVTEEYATAERLRKSEEIFQTMLALIPDMISIHDPDMNIVYSNWNGFAAVPPDRRVLGEKCYRAYRGQDTVCPDCQARQVIETKSPYAEEVELPEGRWVELHVIPILDADGSCELFVEWVRDITERKETEERIRHMEKMDAIGQLAGGVAHDFNNQLCGIMGYAGMLSARLEDASLRRYAENILASANRAGDLTAKLLAFARKGQYQSVSVNMHDIIHDVVDFLSHSIDKKIEIKQILTASPCFTKGDPTQLQNALLNLAINASDAMQDGGELVFETANSELDAEYCASVPYGIEPGRYLHICISDTGCGIPKENLERIFEPFFTTKEVGKGTGMGLAAVYGTVKQHGGAINVYSEIGQGTTFRLYLPLDTEGVVVENQADDTVRAAREAAILVLDDEQVIRDMTEDLLADLGYTVTVKNNGESGLAYFREHWREIDLVILDMVMPRMNGPEAFRAMKEIDPDVKVLLASGYSAGGATRDLLAEGVRGFIQKPFARAELSAKVAEALRDAPN